MIIYLTYICTVKILIISIPVFVRIVDKPSQVFSVGIHMGSCIHTVCIIFICPFGYGMGLVSVQLGTVFSAFGRIIVDSPAVFDKKPVRPMVAACNPPAKALSRILCNQHILDGHKAGACVKDSAAAPVLAGLCDIIGDINFTVATVFHGCPPVRTQPAALVVSGIIPGYCTAGQADIARIEIYPAPRVASSGIGIDPASGGLGIVGCDKAAGHIYRTAGKNPASAGPAAVLCIFHGFSFHPVIGNIAFFLNEQLRIGIDKYAAAPINPVKVSAAPVCFNLRCFLDFCQVSGNNRIPVDGGICIFHA